jgi:transposase
MTNLFINAEEIATITGVSKSYAYKMIQLLNKEMESKGFMTISGKVNRRFFLEKLGCGADWFDSKED